MAGVRPAAGSVLRKLYSRRGPLICVEQATFVLYLHSCWIGWDELWSLFWFAKGLMRRWAKMQVKPQKPWAPEAIVCECVLLKEASSPCQHGKPGWECAWPQQEHQGQLERGGRKDPEQSFTGVLSNTVASFMHNIWVCGNSMHAVLTVMVNTTAKAVLTSTKKRLCQSLKMKSLAWKPCP